MNDFQSLSNDEILLLEGGRKEETRYFVETVEDSLLLKELRFNYGYKHIGPFLVDEEGKKFELSICEPENSIHLAFISVPEPLRQSGRGHEMLEILTLLSDRYGYTLDLTIDARYGVPHDVLKRFYENHGFSYDEEYELMIRTVKL